MICVNLMVKSMLLYLQNLGGSLSKIKCYVMSVIIAAGSHSYSVPPSPNCTATAEHLVLNSTSLLTTPSGPPSLLSCYHF